MAGSSKEGEDRVPRARRLHTRKLHAPAQLAVTRGWGGSDRDRSPSLGPAIPDLFLLPPKLQVTAPTPRNPRFS